MDQSGRTQKIKERMKEFILVLDGAMGTAIQNKNLTAKDFGGAEYEGCNEILILTHPEVICEIHESYLKAGCDILETNTFGATPLVLAEYNLSPKTYEINFKAATLAKQLALKYSTDLKPRFVAGAMGPTTKAISVTGGIHFEELKKHFYEQAKALFEGGVDYLLLETCQDTRNIKAALIAMEELFVEKKAAIPIAVSGTIEPTGTMLAGQTPEAWLTSIQHLDLLYVGLNCATGPEFMTDPIRTLSKLSPFPLACVPNAGLPDENGHYLETPIMVTHILSRFIQSGWLNLIGGCCGTTPKHIEAMCNLVQNQKPRQARPDSKSTLSGIDYLEITEDLRPILVGERCNVIGSKKFKTLICDGKFEEASEVARAQIKNGAQIVDVCLANPDRDELEDMRSYLEKAIRQIKTPIMIDSTDDKVIESALTYCQGKALINSINLEEGEERFKKVIPLAKRFGAAIVVGTIDEDPIQGMGVTRERKLSIAERSFELLTQKYKVLPQDIYWDPLVFPCGTGDAQYVGSARETIEGIKLIKARFPMTKTVLGISNVSFGLPSEGREVLNSVFLYHCVQAGLDLAIVNSEKLVRYTQISEIEKTLAENLLFNHGADPVTTFANHFRQKKPVKKEEKQKLPLLERLPQYILEGSKEGLVPDLDTLKKTMKPLEIINGPLMKGMDEVGRLFNLNQLIVAEVLQSAEVMKAAVSHLEPFMEKTESSHRGKVILATVKGDVHDIGKNLVEIILSNNGFQVINLGIKVPPEQLIQAIRTHRPDIVGLSGLLVKSAQQMVLTAEDFSKAEIATPILVGGAALTENFVLKQISKAYTGTVAYAKDAMKGLDLAKIIMDPKSFEKLKSDLKEKREKNLASQSKPNHLDSGDSPNTRSTQISLSNEVPKPPDFERHLFRTTSRDLIWKYINPLMLYGRHLGLKGSAVRALETGTADPKSQLIFEAVQDVKKEYRDSDIMQPMAVYQFFKAQGNGNKVGLFSDDKKEIAQFEFPRQPKKNGLCLSDYLLPQGDDNLALFVVTAGKGVRERSEQLKNEGQYLKSHIVQALALETAEAYAEFLHCQIRNAWGYPDPAQMTMMERFQAKYRGKRYSFGYPACPKLDDQTLLFQLLKPEAIGVTLTEGFMMDPEASVSAIVFHHPQATYYSVGHTDGEMGDNRS